MHIRLVPAYPHPNIVFTFALPDPMHDDKKPCPPAWMMQAHTVQALQGEGLDLDLPKDMHSFDKAAWHTALMAEVVFDLSERTIVCNFIDESSVTWPMSSSGDIGCIMALEGVVSDVHGASELEKQRSRNAELRQLQTSSYQGLPSAPPVSPMSANPAKTHKRQKSLFSSIVAAVKGALSDNANRTTLPLSLPPLKIPPTPSHSRSPSTFSRTQRSPPPSPTVAEPQPQPVFHLQVRPRVPIPLPSHNKPKPPSERLRHRARSSLVDIFRQYVLPVFSTTGCPSFVETQWVPDWRAQLYGFPAGQYPGWMGRSVLRKTEERMREMIAEASAHGFGSLGLGPTQTPSLLRDAEDEDDATSASTSASATGISTETDGSSLHTPTDSPTYSPFAPSIVGPSGGAPRLSPLQTKVTQQVPRSPSPPLPTFDFDLSAYHALASARSRLLAVLSRLDSSPRQITSVTRYSPDLAILEIKSRRRAWSARDYVGGARMTLIGLATPFCSSPLARCESFTAEALAHAQAQPARGQGRPNVGGGRSFIGLSDINADMGVKVVTKEMDARLFSVSEEEEEVDDGPGYKSGYSLDDYVEDEGWRDVHEFDLESGLLAFPRPESEKLTGDTSRVYAHLHPMVRTRTQSIRKEHPRGTQKFTQLNTRTQAEGALSSSSLLCQSLIIKVPVPVVLQADQSFEYDEDRTGEFTLAMDLPPPPRGWLGDDVDGVSCR